MAQLRAIYSNVFSYLSCIGFHKWARSHFYIIRYNIMITNIPESINNILKYADQLSVIIMSEFLRVTIQKWLYTCHSVAMKMRNYLTH